MRHTKPTTKQISLIRRGHYVEIRSAPQELYEQFGNINESPRWRKESDEPLPFRAMAGHEPAIRDWLRRNRFLAVDRDERPLPELGPRRSPDEHDFDDPAVLQFLEDFPRARVEYHAGSVSPARLITQIARAWPEMRIAVCAARPEVLYGLRKNLRGIAPALHCSVHDRNEMTEPAERVALCSPRAIATPALQTKTRPLVIMVDPVEILGSRGGKQVLGAAAKSRLLGLCDAGKRLSKSDRLRLLGLFGAQRLVVPRHGFMVRHMRALFTTVKGGRQLSRQMPLADVLRHGVWQHDLRNRRLSNLATALADRDLGTIRSFLPGVRDLPITGRVAVLASNVPHALRLAQRLPGWRLVLGTDRDLGGLPPNLLALIDEQEKRRPRNDRRFLTTASGLERIRRLDVLLRADVGIEHPPLHWAIARQGTPRASLPATVIDLTDRNHKLLADYSRARCESYLLENFELPQVFPKPLDRYRKENSIVFR